MKKLITTSIVLFLCLFGIYILHNDERPLVDHKIEAPLQNIKQNYHTKVPATPLSAEELSKSMSPISGETHVIALNLIMDWIKNQQVFTEEDRDILLEYLTQTKPESLSTGEWNERVNEILNILRSQPEEVPGLADLLIHMVVKDPDSVMRMYALQHLAMWLPSETSAENRMAMLELLKRIAETPQDPLAGSAVLFLNDVSTQTGVPSDLFVSGEIIELAALRLVDDQASKPDVRISALHTCVARGMKDALPSTRLIATDSKLMIPLRKAAIYTIGELGTFEDIILLESLDVTNSKLSVAITPALMRLKADRKIDSK